MGVMDVKLKIKKPEIVTKEVEVLPGIKIPIVDIELVTPTPIDMLSELNTKIDETLFKTRGKK